MSLVKMTKALVILLLASTMSFGLLADDVYLVVIKKAVEKKQSRWSLTEWMSTKRKIEEMDRWLALNSDWPVSIFEGYLEGSFTNTFSYRQDNYPSQGVNAVGGKAGFFLAFLGIEAAADESPLKWDQVEGQISLRILGNYEQNNNLTLGYGRRFTRFNVEENALDDKFKNDYASARLNLMLATFLGVRGEYRHYFSSTSLTEDKKVSGTGIETTAYLDIININLFATYFKENWKLGQDKLVREGMRYGMRFYF